VVVDPALEQEDRNRSNNTATKTVLAPGLTISVMTVLQPSVTDRIINARCANLGTIPTASLVEVVFHEGTPTVTGLATVPISALPTNGVYDASFERNLSGRTFTSAFVLVYATVDEANTVSEADKDYSTRLVSVMTTLDTDGDGLLDGEEAHYGTNPLLADSDGDGMPDGWEIAHGLNPLINDALADPDGDGFSNLEEFLGGSDPRDPASIPRTDNTPPTSAVDSISPTRCRSPLPPQLAMT
jgi:hypothetical protein